jgi:5-methylcytosine-specific restriction endonuclease McrA
MPFMNEQLRKKILGQTPKSTGIKNITRLRAQLKELAGITPPPDYDKYIRSKAWKVKRETFLVAYHHQCVICGNKKNLHVHHLHYQTVGHEKLEDVVVCCRRCHFIEHLPHKDNPAWVSTSSSQHTNKSETR